MNLTKLNQSDHCVHFSCPERSVSTAVYILLYMCSAAVVLLTVCGNLLVIISVFHFKQLHTPTNTLVLSLALSDFFIGVFVMPPMLIWTIESCWIFGTVFCISYWLIVGFFTILSINNVALIAVDRYMALSNPFLYMNRVSVRRTYVVIISDWCVIAVYNLVLFYVTGNFSGIVMCPGACVIFLNEVWSVINLVYAFILPCSVIIIFYTLVFVIAKKHATAIREFNNHTQTKTQKTTSYSMKSERKAAKVLGILVSVFLMCLLPYFIYSLLGGVIELEAQTFQKLVIVGYLNSTINPVIYALFYPWFRRCIKLIITLQIFQTDSALINVLS